MRWPVNYFQIIIPINLTMRILIFFSIQVSFISSLPVSNHRMFTVKYRLCNILSCEKTEGIMLWKVHLHTVVSNNAVRGQQALLLLRRVMGSGGLCGELCKAVK